MVLCERIRSAFCEQFADEIDAGKLFAQSTLRLLTRSQDNATVSLNEQQGGSEIPVLLRAKHRRNDQPPTISH